MKFTGSVALVAVLLMFCAGELCAQSSSSATQTVTFGVRIVAVQPMTAGQALESFRTFTASPFKVTVGSDAKAEEAAALTLPTAPKALASSKSTLFDGRDLGLAFKSATRQGQKKSVVTITE